MRLDNGSADPKSHSGAVWFGGKERIEDLVCLLRGQPHASIADRDQELFVFRSLRFDDEFARSIDILHGIDTVHDQIHYDLLQLHPISHDVRKILRQFGPEKYSVSRCLAMQEDDYCLNNSVYIHRLALRSAPLEEQANPADDVGRTRPIFHN